MIIHSPIISGSLTFADGATFTLPDNGEYSGSFSGSIQVDEVRSHLIPDSSASYDLGSEAFPFRDIYISSGTAIIGGIGISSSPSGLNFKKKSDDSPADLGAKTITLGGPIGGVGSKKFKLNENNKVTLEDENGDVDTIEVKEIVLKDTSGNGKNTVVKNDNGRFTTQEVNDSGSVTALDSEGSLSGSFTGSVLDLSATGDATFNDAVTVSGLSSLDGGVNVDDNFTVDASGNTSVGGTLDSTGLASLDGGIDVDGVFTVSNTSGNVSTTGTLSAGATTLTSTVDVTGLASLDGGIDVDGVFTVADSTGNVSTTGTLAAGNTTITGTVDATGLASLDGGIDVDGAFTVANSSGNVSTTGTITVPEGNLTIGSTAVSATATELNILQGATVTTTEINRLDGITVDATKLNYLSDMEGNVKNYIDTEVSGIVDSAPATLDTLNELAAALGDDANFATTTSTALGNRLRLDVDNQSLSGTQITNALANLGVTSTNTEINLVDGSSAGTVVNSKAVVYGAAGEVNATKLQVGGVDITSTPAELNLLDGVSGLVQADFTKLAAVDVTAAEINYLDGVSSNIQTQLDDKIALTAISATDDGGDGSFSYDNTTGVFTYTGPSATEVRAHFSDGTGVTITDGEISIGQSVGTGDSVTFSTVSATGDIVAYASSDERLKDNIQVISNPIKKVQQLKGVTWDWNDNADELQKSLPNVGVIAQDVEKVLPQLVKDRDNGYKGVDYDKIVGLLIEAIKDQQSQIDELKAQIK